MQVTCLTCATHLGEVIVSTQVLAIGAACLGTQQCHVAMVLGLGLILLGCPELVVEGHGSKAQLSAVQAVVALSDEVYGGGHPVFKALQWQQGLQHLEATVLSMWGRATQSALPSLSRWVSAEALKISLVLFKGVQTSLRPALPSLHSLGCLQAHLAVFCINKLLYEEA